MRDFEKIEISMFGDFTVKYGDKSVGEKDDRSWKKWTLLKYLITFREREVAGDELMNLLWSDGDSGNPSIALKAQIRRLRVAIHPLELPEDTDMVVCDRGDYAFNGALNCVVDTDEFERFFKLSLQPVISEKEQIDYCIKAIDVYKGDFLQNSVKDEWVTPINVYYHLVYLRVVHRTVDFLYRNGRFSEVVDVCRKALAVDKLDQRIHCMLIKGLIEINEQLAAKRHYDYVTDMFYDKEGISLSGEFLELLKDIIKTDRKYETDLDTVRMHLNENTPVKGALFCEYEFFRHIYRLEMRDAERTGKKIHICLITIAGQQGGSPETKNIQKAAQRLKNSIGMSLRASDIFSRYNALQFIIMLLSSNDDTSEKIMGRVVRQYKRNYPKSPVKLIYSYGMAKLD